MKELLDKEKEIRSDIIDLGRKINHIFIKQDELAEELVDLQVYLYNAYNDLQNVEKDLKIVNLVRVK